MMDGKDSERGVSSGGVSKRRLLLLALFLIPLLLRLGYVAQVEGQLLYRVLIEDELSYDTQAKEIAAGDLVGDEIFYQSPLYPYFMAAVYSLFGPKPEAVRLVQAVLGALSCLLLFLAGERLFGTRVGVASSVIGAFYGIFVFHDSLILKASLVVFLTCALLLTLVSRLRYQSPPSWVQPGMVLGLLVLVRGNAYVYFPFILLWIVLFQRERWLKKSLFLLGGMAIVLLPVTARNIAVGGDFVLSESQAGTNFYIGNNPRATGTYVPLVEGRSTPRFEQEDARRLAVAGSGRDLKPSEVSRFWFAESWRFIRSDPPRFLRLTIKKFAMFFAGEEIPDTRDYYFYRSRSLALQGAFFNFSLVFALGMLGLSFTRRDRAASSLLLGLILAAAASVIPFYIFARYRLPVVVPLIVLSGYAVVHLYETARRREFLKLAVPAVSASLLMVTVNLADFPVGSSLTLFNTALALNARGERQEALHVLSAAIETDPAMSDSYYVRAQLYEQKGLFELALADFSKYVVLEPGTMRGYARRGDLYAALGRYEEALADYTSAIRLEPADGDLFNARGMIFGKRGDWQKALADFVTALRVTPNNPAILMNIQNVSRLAAADPDIRLRFNEFLAQETTEHERHLILGFILFREGRGKEALAEFALALASRAEAPVAHTYRGLTHLKMGMNDQAVEDFGRAIELDPIVAESYRFRGMAYLNSRNYGRALEDYDRAVQLSPSDALLRLDRALVHERSGRMEKALEDYSGAISLQPSDPQTYRRRAAVYRALGRGDEAAEDEKRAREMEAERARGG